MAIAQIKAAPTFSVAGKRAVLATLHGKEQVIRPLLEGGLGLQVHIPERFDTDRFGTFSREIERTGNQIYAARAKIDGAFKHDPQAQVAIASEGSFGPHPHIFFALSGARSCDARSPVRPRIDRASRRPVDKLHARDR